MKKLRLYILIALIALTALVSTIKVSAQANGNTGSTGSYSPWKVLNGVISPQSTAWTLKLPYLSDGCLYTVSDVVTSTGSACGSGGSGGSGNVATSSSETSGYFPTWTTTNGTPAKLSGTSQIFQTGASVGIGTTNPCTIVGTAFSLADCLQLQSNTKFARFTLSGVLGAILDVVDNTGTPDFRWDQLITTNGQFYFRSVLDNGDDNFYFLSGDNSTGDVTLGTNNHLIVQNAGFGTTTVTGLNITGSATSTSNVGFNITGGCFAKNGTCISSSAVSSGYPFPVTGNATTTLTQFNGGLTSYATTTIGNGTVTGGLTVAGNATTSGDLRVFGNNFEGNGAAGTSFFDFFAGDPLRTRFNIKENHGYNDTLTLTALSSNVASFDTGSGNLAFAGGNIFFAGDDVRIGIGSSTPGTSLSIGGTGNNTINLIETATSTFGSGINLRTGCFAINGTCISAGAGGSGTVTSVAMTVPTGFTISGTPVTTSGTLALGVSFPSNGIITANAAGTGLIATTSQLTVGSLISTTTANSFFTGNLGIASTSPAQKLSVVGQTTLDSSVLGLSNYVYGGSDSVAALRVSRGDVTSRFIDFYPSATGGYSKIQTGGYDTTLFTGSSKYAFDGIMSIGTTTTFAGSPGWGLDIAGGSVAQLGLTDTTAAANVKHWVERSRGGYLYFDTASDTTYATTSTVKLSLDSSGNAVISNSLTTPTHFGGTAVGSSLTLQSTSGVGTTDFIKFLVGNNGATEIGRMVSGGAFALGTTTPLSLASFEIASNTPYFYITDNNAPLNSKHWQITNTDGVFNIGTTSDATYTATSSIFSISAPTIASPGTTVGIASSSPWRTLGVTGTVGFDGLTGSAGLQVGILCLSANKEVINESVACVASAARYKENIKTLTVGLDELLKLKPVSFEWKDSYNGDLKNNPNYTGIQYSLIADEVQKIDPHLVTVETEPVVFEGKTYSAGSVHGLADTNHWVALFTQAIKDFYAKFQLLVARVSGLEKKVENQQKQIDSLTERLNKLEKK